MKLLDFRADFSKENPSLNICKFSHDNTLLATGGDDCISRVYAITTGSRFSLETIPQEGPQMEPICKLEGHSDIVNSLAFSPDNHLLVTSSSDRSCLIFNVNKEDKKSLGQRLHKITFSDGTHDTKNLMMRGCFFSTDGRYLYTLSTESRQKSYLVKWENKQRFTQKAV